MTINLNNLSSKDTKVKYNTQKDIIKLSKTNPLELYPNFDFFVELLNSKNNIMIWTGLIVLGNLAKIDSLNKIEKVLPQIIKKLNAGKMITAGNAMRSLISIAFYKKEIADNLALEILKSKNYKYDTDTCHDIHIGHMFKCIELIWNILSEDVKRKYINLARKEINNSRSATNKKAILFLKKFN
jgi:hypothetical protein